MSKKVQNNPKNNVPHKSETKPRCIAFYNRGITNSSEFLNANHAVIADVVAGNITPTVANSAFAGGRNTLKMLELQHKYGRVNGKDPKRMLEIGN